MPEDLHAFADMLHDCNMLHGCLLLLQGMAAACPRCFMQQPHTPAGACTDRI